MSTELDWRRLPHEIRRSMLLDHGLFAARVEPGLSMIPGTDPVQIVDRHGAIVALIPMYRLQAVDLEYLAGNVAAITEPSPELDQALAAIAAGRIHDRPDRAYVIVPTGEDLQSITAAMVVSRAAAVPSWPTDDQGEAETALAELDAIYGRT